jgi:hypothetical protein
MRAPPALKSSAFRSMQGVSDLLARVERLEGSTH